MRSAWSRSEFRLFVFVVVGPVFVLAVVVSVMVAGWRRPPAETPAPPPMSTTAEPTTEPTEPLPEPTEPLPDIDVPDVDAPDVDRPRHCNRHWYC